MNLNKITKTIFVTLFLLSLGINTAFLYNSSKQPLSQSKRRNEATNAQRSMHWLKNASLSEDEARLFRQRLQEFEKECRIIEKQSHELRQKLLEEIIAPEENNEKITTIKQQILQKQALLQDMTIKFLNAQKDELGPEKQRRILEYFMRMNRESRGRRRRGRHHLRADSD